MKMATTNLPERERVLQYLDDHHDASIAWLLEYLAIPSVSPDKTFASSMHDARSFLLHRLRESGLENVQLLDGGGEPAVYGEWLGAPGRPTVMVYGHYDVMPADPVALWRTPPFDPTLLEGRIYARGASDVKGPTTVALEVVRAFLGAVQRAPLNIKVFLEGEEETGSPSLRELVGRHRDLLRADAVISADGGRASKDVPTINVGARGNAQLEVRLQTAAKDLHSGRYGGAVRNALHELARVVASMHREDGSVAVDGFSDGAAAPTRQQREDTAAFPYDEPGFFTTVDAASHGEPGYTPRERVTLRPSLDVNGMWGGYTGLGGKTIIPSEAFAKLTVRVVEGQDPGTVIRSVLAHMERRCPQGCRLEVVSINDGAPASTLSPSHPLVLAAESVLGRGSNHRPIHVRLGASVPITSLFKETLGIGTLMFGFNLPDEDVHAPNEFFRLASIKEGTTAWTDLIYALAQFPQSQFAAGETMHSR